MHLFMLTLAPEPRLASCGASFLCKTALFGSHLSIYMRLHDLNYTLSQALTLNLILTLTPKTA